MKAEVIESRSSALQATAPQASIPRAGVNAQQEQSQVLPFLRMLLFFGFIVAAALGLDQLFTFGLRRIPTSSFGASNQIFSGRVNAEIVVSGSSRAQVQYDPGILQQSTGLTAFNIGRNGSQTDLQLAMLKAYLKHNRKPRLLIHNLDSFSFQTSHELYDPGQYLPYLREPDIYQALARVNPGVWKSKYVPLYGYAVEDMRFTWMLGLRAVFGWFPKEDYSQGFSPGYRRWTGDFERFKAQNPDGVRFQIEPEGERDLEELVAICRQQGIPVLLVYSPVYWEMQQLERGRAELFAKFQQLATRYRAVFWDYSGSPICRERDLFYNSQHLNADGARRFSLDLAQRLASERPWESGHPGAQPTRDLSSLTR